MKKFATVFAMALLILALGSGLAFAQSSGNFSASATAAACKIGADGSFGTSGASITELDANISTSNGSGVTLDIRPSLVTGLFTDTKISAAIPSATADVGITVCVTVDGSGAGILPASCVNYDERFQQISSQLFSQIAACTLASSTCTVNTDCLAGDTCFNPTAAAGAGTCIGPPTATACSTTADCLTAGLLGDICDTAVGFCAPTAGAANPLCNFELLLSTLSAHSFDFVIPIGKGKPHEVKVTWSTTGTPSSPSSNVASCVGPGIVTVTQYKVFNNSGSLLTF